MFKCFLFIIFLCGSSYAQNRESYINQIKHSQNENKLKETYKISKEFYKKFPKDTLAIIYYAYNAQELDYYKNKNNILKLYDELIKTDTNNINFYNLKGFYYLRIEDYINGIQLAKKSLSRKSNLETNLLLALLYEGKLDTINANQYFIEAYKIDSNNSFLNYKFAYTCYYRRNYSRSAKYFIRFIELIKNKNESNSFAFIPDLIISLWYINDKEKVLYYWKTYSKNNEAHYNYRFNNNLKTKEIKEYCESR